MTRLHCDEPDLFSEITRYIDARAARAWPAASVKALAAIAEQCISFQARSRPEAGEVVSRLEELVLTESTAQPLGDKTISNPRVLTRAKRGVHYLIKEKHAFLWSDSDGKIRTRYYDEWSRRLPLTNMVVGLAAHHRPSWQEQFFYL